MPEILAPPDESNLEEGYENFDLDETEELWGLQS